MKATLSFSLPDEREEHETAVHAMDYRAVLGEVDNKLRDCLKYGHTYKSIEEAFDGIRQLLLTEMAERGINT